jgi:hypothetical protein
LDHRLRLDWDFQGRGVCATGIASGPSPRGKGHWCSSRGFSLSCHCGFFLANTWWAPMLESRIPIGGRWSGSQPNRYPGQMYGHTEWKMVQWTLRASLIHSPTNRLSHLHLPFIGHCSLPRLFTIAPRDGAGIFLEYSFYCETPARVISASSCASLPLNGPLPLGCQQPIFAITSISDALPRP